MFTGSENPYEQALKSAFQRRMREKEERERKGKLGGRLGGAGLGALIGGLATIATGGAAAPAIGIGANIGQAVGGMASNAAMGDYEAALLGLPGLVGPSVGAFDMAGGGGGGMGYAAASMPTSQGTPAMVDLPYNMAIGGE